MIENSDSPLVCVIVLNFNGRKHLEYCLPSIAASQYYPFKIIVVDNASSDNSVDYIIQNYPEMTLLISSTNRGWSGGNNLGIAHAQELGANYIILANNDIRVDKRWISMAVGVAQEDRRIGIVGFRVIEAHGVHAMNFEHAVTVWPGLKTSTSPVVNGMAMFVRTELFRQIGMIDEGFFAYAEDNDLILRAQRAGYRVVTTNIPVWHHGAGTFGRTPLWAAALQIRNNIRLSLKHDPPAGVVYQLIRHFAKCCLPFVQVDPRNRVARRLRPSNIFVNFAIFVYAIIWNLWHLPATLWLRRKEARRLQAARHHLRLT
jgi:GT2 family glycosyltransferase